MTTNLKVCLSILEKKGKKEKKKLQILEKNANKTKSNILRKGWNNPERVETSNKCHKIQIKKYFFFVKFVTSQKFQTSSTKPVLPSNEWNMRQFMICQLLLLWAQCWLRSSQLSLFSFTLCFLPPSLSLLLSLSSCILCLYFSPLVALSDLNCVSVCFASLFSHWSRDANNNVVVVGLRLHLDRQTDRKKETKIKFNHNWT